MLRENKSHVVSIHIESELKTDMFLVQTLNCSEFATVLDFFHEFIEFLCFSSLFFNRFNNLLAKDTCSVITHQQGADNHWIYHEQTLRSIWFDVIMKCLPPKIMLLNHCADDFIYFSLCVLNMGWSCYKIAKSIALSGTFTCSCILILYFWIL